VVSMVTPANPQHPTRDPRDRTAGQRTAVSNYATDDICKSLGDNPHGKYTPTLTLLFRFQNPCFVAKRSACRVTTAQPKVHLARYASITLIRIHEASHGCFLPIEKTSGKGPRAQPTVLRDWFEYGPESASDREKVPTIQARVWVAGLLLEAAH